MAISILLHNLFLLRYSKYFLLSSSPKIFAHTLFDLPLDFVLIGLNPFYNIVT